MQTSTEFRVRLWAAALALCVSAAYVNSFWGAFVYDDMPNIVNNEALRDLSNPRRLFLDPQNVTRPVVAFTLAIDYALFGKNPGGYHAFNLAAHLAAALLLFGILRRTLLSAKLRARFGANSTLLAFLVALLWALHPLQTESVTYVVQRAESMMGMFFLLALYASIRLSEDGAPRLWRVAAIAAAILGAGCKQVIVVLPVIVILYERCFVDGSFKAAFKRSKFLYAGLCLAIPVVALTLALAPHVGSAGYGMDKIKWYNYGWSQFVAICHYLKLSVWPFNLCLNYVWSIERDPWRVVPSAVFVLTLLGVTAWQVARNTAIGFLGAWFFVILAPTSSVMPLADVVFEHRMYLPLAALAAWAVLGVYDLIARGASRHPNSRAIAAQCVLAMFVLVALEFGVLTAYRNTVYFDSDTMWRDILAKRPANPNAHYAVAGIWFKKGDLNRAREEIDKTVELRPRFPQYQILKGYIQRAQGDLDGAVVTFKTALTLNPNLEMGWSGLNTVFIERDKGNAEIEKFANAAKESPRDPELHLNLGKALPTAGRFSDAVFEFDTVLALHPGYERAMYYRGLAVAQLLGEGEAIAFFRAELAGHEDRALVASGLAWMLATSSEDSLRDGAKAVELAERACAQTQNKIPAMLDALAAAYAETGKFDKAVETEETALKLPNLAPGTAKGIEAHRDLFKTGKPVREKTD